MWYQFTQDNFDFSAGLDYNIKYIDNASLAIDKIIQNYPAPYHLMVSGGIDSQAMLYAWKLFGKNFIPTSVKYNDNLNHDDLIHLNEFSKKNKIEVNYIDFDVIEFYENSYDAIANEYNCPSPHFAVHIAMAQNLPGTIIYSGNYLNIPVTYFPSSQLAFITQSRKRSCVPFFFLSHPDLAYMQLKKLMLLTDEKCKLYFKNNSYLDTVKEYHELGFPVIPQSAKQTGFEKIKSLYDQKYLHTIPKTKLMYYWQKRRNKRAFDILLRYPYEKKLNFRYLSVTLNEDVITLIGNKLEPFFSISNKSNLSAHSRYLEDIKNFL